MEKLYSCEQVAERYGVKVDTIWTWIRERKLNAIQISKRIYRITESELSDFEQKNNTGNSEATEQEN